MLRVSRTYVCKEKRKYNPELSEQLLVWRYDTLWCYTKYGFFPPMLSSVSDPHIKVTGLPDDVREAKDLLLAVLDTKVWWWFGTQTYMELVVDIHCFHEHLSQWYWYNRAFRMKSERRHLSAILEGKQPVMTTCLLSCTASPIGKRVSWKEGISSLRSNIFSM